MGSCYPGERQNPGIHNLETVVHQSDGTTYSLRDHDREITKYMKRTEQKETEVIKILLLGIGSSGKTTLFRQIECIHGEDNPNRSKSMNRFFVDIMAMKRMIRINSINGLTKLLQKSEILSKDPYNFADCFVDVTDPEIEDMVTKFIALSKNRTEHFGNDEWKQEELTDLGQHMAYLWALDGVQATFKRRQYFSLPENMDYFFDKILAIMNDDDDEGYTPSMEDILNARMQTTGIIERKYRIQEIQFKMFDVGGQRNERRKWIQLFDNVHAVIFVAALNHYCCVLFEDETVNAMEESLQIFDDTINCKWFAGNSTQFILFLNKNDLFITRLQKDKIPLSICFKDKYKGGTYADRADDEFKSEKDQKAWFKTCYKESISFVKNQYLKRGRKSRKNIITHVTTATDQRNIKKVFDSVRIGIISQVLQSCAQY